MNPFELYIRRSAGPLLWLCGLTSAGCASLVEREPSFPEYVPAAQKSAPVASPVRQAAAVVPADPVLPTAQALPRPAPLPPVAELSAEFVVEQVLVRNPSLAQMVAAWQEATARYPQVTSLDDPMLGTTVAPGAVGQLGDGNRGYRIDVAQKLPWPGKLALRGENARAGADAAGRDVDDTRLRLVESARSALYEYYLVGRALEVNAEALRLLKEFRDNAETRYKTGQVPQQDILQADVEIGRQRERQLTLERMREVAVARINTLMHLPTNAALPPPPKTLRPPGPVPPVEALQAAALARRPDLQALAARVAAEEASVALANKEFYPDFEVLGAYDSFWGEKQQQAQVGLRLNLPVRTSRRYAAVDEARARVAQKRAELDRLRDQANFQVQEASAQVRESERAVRLYDAEILPAAEANVKSAQSAYVTGKIPFLSLIEAERNLVGLRDRYYETLADYFRRQAGLERAVGGPLPTSPAPPAPPTEGSK